MNQGGGPVKVNPAAVKGQMKGLLKGLRYISQIFDEDEEKEIQIGFPTDVKHLAHIGCDDAKATAPSWMTEFKELQEQPGANAKISESQDSSGNNSDNNTKGDGKKNHVRRSRQRSTESQSLPSSPQREETGTIKPSRRHHSSEASRRNKSNDEEENNKPPKQSHRRKPKTNSEEKDKDSSNRRRTRRSSKADSLTDASFTDLGSGPASGPSAQ